MTTALQAKEAFMTTKERLPAIKDNVQYRP
jgi:hypothetical protein